jgi:hypothetical protein
MAQSVPSARQRFSIDAAVLTFSNQNLLLRAPHKWDDPYEKWWSQQLFRPDSKLVKAKAYGLCWTTRDRDEPIWRLYMCPAEPKMPAIRLRTTVGALCARMTRLAERKKEKAFMGRVRYKPAAELKRLAKKLTTARDDQVARNAALGLLWKREQFMLEEEVRLLWIETSKRRAARLRLPFDHLNIINQVMIGPSTGTRERNTAARELKLAGVPAHLINFSTIYDPPAAS